MDTQMPWSGSSSTISANERRLEVEILLRTLLQVLGSSMLSPLSAGTHTGGEILLDAEIEGTRFVLLSITPAQPDERPLFSPREIEIARMVAKGYANKTIAAVLEISVNTVNTHLRRVFAKLGVTTRAAMVTCLANHYTWVEVLDNATRQERKHNPGWERGAGEHRAPGRPMGIEPKQEIVPRAQALEPCVAYWLTDG
jgi:DNA-binding CsgD family transcriptional regulator